jgi:hypothetical protein
LLVVSLSINRLARVIAAGTSEFIWPGLYDQRAFVARPRDRLKTAHAPEGPEPSAKLKRGRTIDTHRSCALA